jgi:hypothetical protein
MMEKALWLFAGVLVGGVVLAALARVSPKVASMLVDRDDAAERPTTPTTPTTPTGELAAKLPLQRLAPGLMSDRVTIGAISPTLLRLLPAPGIVGA